MKTALLVSMLLATGASAAPVAVVKTSGGFTPTPRSTVLTLDADGTLTLTKTVGSWNSTEVTSTSVEVAKLNTSIVKAIVDDVAEANNTNVVAENPEAPECMDAPSTTYSVVKDGALVLIGKLQNCKPYSLEDYQGQTAMRLLESLKTLSQAAE